MEFHRRKTKKPLTFIDVPFGAAFARNDALYMKCLDALRGALAVDLVTGGTALFGPDVEVSAVVVKPIEWDEE